MTGLVDQILNSLNKGNAVAIHGGSGVGKSETMRLIKCLLEQEGKRVVYMDMRYFKSIFEFDKEVCNQLGVEYEKRREFFSEFKNRDVALLFDEYWARGGFVDSLTKFAYDKGNNVITVAGNPFGVKLDEYIIKKREI